MRGDVAGPGSFPPSVLPAFPSAPVEATSALGSAGLLDILRGIVNGPALPTAMGACPSLIDAVLWIARHYEFLHSINQPMTAAICPAVRVSWG